MDTSLVSGISAGGLGGIVIAICIIIYKCCERKKYKSHLGCIDFQVEADLNAQGATVPVVPIVPPSTPILESKRASVEPPELKEHPLNHLN